MKFGLSKGFTLVELLIVIGLLGAIALIVISAINPIEQANKARDARFKADASQMISAVERYYASNSKFPWEGCASPNCKTTSSEEFAFISVGDPAVGLCSTDACSAGGLLVTSNELKNEFLGRDWAKTADDDLKIFMGKATGSSSSVYACFIPKAKSSQDVAVTNDTVRSLSFTAGGVPATNATCTSSTDDWAVANCYVCIPE